MNIMKSTLVNEDKYSIYGVGISFIFNKKVKVDYIKDSLNINSECNNEIENNDKNDNKIIVNFYHNKNFCDLEENLDENIFDKIISFDILCDKNNIPYDNICIKIDYESNISNFLHENYSIDEKEIEIERGKEIEKIQSKIVEQFIQLNYKQIKQVFTFLSIKQRRLYIHLNEIKQNNNFFVIFNENNSNIFNKMDICYKNLFTIDDFLDDKCIFKKFEVNNSINVNISKLKSILDFNFINNVDNEKNDFKDVKEKNEFNEINEENLKISYKILQMANKDDIDKLTVSIQNQIILFSFLICNFLDYEDIKNGYILTNTMRESINLRYSILLYLRTYTFLKLIKWQINEKTLEINSFFDYININKLENSNNCYDIFKFGDSSDIDYICNFQKENNESFYNFRTGLKIKKQERSLKSIIKINDKEYNTSFNENYNSFNEYDIKSETIEICIKSGNIIPWLEQCSISSFYSKNENISFMIFPDNEGNAIGYLMNDNYNFNNQYNSEFFTEFILIEVKIVNYKKISFRKIADTYDLKMSNEQNNNIIKEDSNDFVKISFNNLIDNIYIFDSEILSKIQSIEYLENTFEIPLNLPFSFDSKTNMFIIKELMININTEFTINLNDYE